MNRLMIRHTMDKPLPYDAEVEYISMNVPYLEAFGLVPIKGYIDVVVSITNNGTTSSYAECIIIGGYNQSYINTCRYDLYRDKDTTNVIEDCVTGSSIIGSANGNKIIRIDVKYDSSHAPNDRYGRFVIKGTYTDTLTVWRLTVKDTAHNIIHDYIPVRVGNVGRLYDLFDRKILQPDYDNIIPGPDYNPFAYQYLTFVPLEDSTFSFAKRGTGNDIEYSIDGGAWTSLASEANTPTVGAGHNIRWRAELVPSTVSGSQGIGTFSASGLYDAMGNTMSLSYGDNFVGQTRFVSNYILYALWQNDTHIYRAARMVLPATSLTRYCYTVMFDGCESLTTAPQLPALILSNYCYYRMFRSCHSIVTAPDLLASNLVTYCYRSMFHGCTNLRYIKMLATDTSANQCLQYWVSEVAPTGTFVKNAAMTTLPTGTSGIPDGWTVVDDPSTINS